MAPPAAQPKTTLTPVSYDPVLATINRVYPWVTSFRDSHISQALKLAALIGHGATEEGFSFDYIDVNMRNADVVEAMICKAFTGADIGRLQRKLRRKMHLSRSDYLKFRLVGPYC